MPRTYSVARLMLGVTLFCVLCGLAVNVPQAALVIVAVGGLLSPTLLIWAALLRFSAAPFLVSINVVSGAVIFFCFAILLTTDEFFSGMMVICLAPAIGALFFGGLSLVTEPHSQTNAERVDD